MIKQCGNCKWWDRENNKYASDGLSDCIFIITDIPSSYRKEEMFNYEGSDCTCFEQIVEDKIN